MRSAPKALLRRPDLAWTVLGAALLIIGWLLGYYVFDDYRRTDQAARDSLQVQVADCRPDH